MTIDEAIFDISRAIAFAEGFYVSGSRAMRNNNPGNLTVDTIGKAVGMDGMFIVYGNILDGWAALERQVELILTNVSNIYNRDMTIYEIAQLYTTTDQLAWATNVASKLGIPIDAKISTLLSESFNVGMIGIIALVLWYFMRK